MRRWTATVSLIVSLLVNIVFVFACGGSQGAAAALSSTAGEVPDCCKDGMCPYHSQEQQHHHSEKPSDSCICDMFSGDTATFMVLSSMPAMISMETLAVVALPLAESPLALVGPDAIDAILIPSTPPPRA